MATTYEVNDDLHPYKTTVFIRSKWGNNWYTGSGVIIGSNDILTASHVIFDKKQGGIADEVRIYPSWDPNFSCWQKRIIPYTLEQT